MISYLPCLFSASTMKRFCRIFNFLFFSVLFLLPTQVAAQAMNSLEVAQKLQNTYKKATSLVADFNQTTSIQFSDRVRQGSGSMIFLKPGRMRWDYLTPDHQIIISDGKTIT